MTRDGFRKFKIMASADREEGSVGRNTGVNSERDQGVEGQGQGLMNNSTNQDRYEGVGEENPAAARSYKEMLEILKHLNKSCDSMTEQICGLNLKYSDVITKAAILIDPEVAKILHGDEDQHREILSTSQQINKISSEELELKYDELSNVLDKRLQQREHNHNHSEPSEMEDLSHNQAQILKG